MKRTQIVSVVGLAILLSSRLVCAQGYYSPSYAPSNAYPTPVRNISGLVSGYEAWQINDVRRRAEIGRQVDLNADMYWRWSGVSSYYPGAFEAWPMVPGNIWGWPAAVSPPHVSSTRVAPQYDPEYATATAQGAESLPPGPPHFSPAPEPSPRRQPSGPRQF